MLIDIQKFHVKWRRFWEWYVKWQFEGLDPRSCDGLKALTLSLVTGQVKPMTMNGCQMGCEGCKNQPYLCYIDLAIMMPLKCE